MIGMPFNLQGNKGVFGVSSDFTSSLSSVLVEGNKWKKNKQQEEENNNTTGSFGFGFGGFGSEPTSVLDSRRSPSTPTSTTTSSTTTTTLSSSLGGGSTGSTDTPSVAAVSDNPLQKWPPTTTPIPTPQEDNNNNNNNSSPDQPQGVGGGGGCSSGGGSSNDGTGGNGKDEWVSELQPVPCSTLEIISSGGGGGGGGGTGGGGGEKYGGLGMEDWDSMLSETAASPSLLRWIIDDVEDPSSGLLQAGVGVGSSEFEGNAGFGIVDPASGFGFEPTTTTNTINGVNSMSINHHPSLSSGFPPNPNNNNNGTSSRLGLNSPLSIPNFNKVPYFPSSNHHQQQVFSPSSTNTLPMNHLPLPLSLPPGMFYHHQQQQQFDMAAAADEKPQLFNPQHLLLNHQNQKNPPFYMPLASFNQQDQQHHLLSPQLKRHHSSMVDPGQIQKPPFMDSGQDQQLYLRRQQHQQQQQQQGLFPPHQLQLLPNHHLQQQQQRPLMANNKPPNNNNNKVVVDEITHHQQQQALVDQLFKAAELVETGNSIHAQGILARLNQLSPVGGKPLQRAAFYFKEALQQLLLLNNNNNNNNVGLGTGGTGTSPPPPPPHRNCTTPLDVVQKIGAYKSFSEISPLLQFSNFTCNQALLEALDQSNHIHIVDFDIGIGGQWASFMQEIAMRMNGSPSLKITAFASPSTSHDHPLELVLTREHLTHFANDLGISFEIDIVSLDSFDPSSWSLPLHVSESEAVAVNLPIGSSSIHPSSLPSLLRLVKQLSPKIVVSMDRGCDRSDLPFSHHFLQALQSYSILLDSLDATNTDPKVINKIEQFLLQPRIESTIMRRHRAAHEKLPPWRTLFASSGFSPLTFSNFTETQAECLVKRLQGRGFHVEKRQGASLVLCWQRRELVSASAWRC